MNKIQLEGYCEAYNDLNFLLNKEKAKMLDKRFDYYNQGRVHALEELLQTMWRKIQNEEQSE